MHLVLEILLYVYKYQTYITSPSLCRLPQQETDWQQQVTIVWRHTNHSTQMGKCRAHDDVVKWKHFPCYWPFVRGIHRRPVTRSCDVFFDLHPNKWLSKQSLGWWFETPSRSLWCQCVGLMLTLSINSTEKQGVFWQKQLQLLLDIPNLDDMETEDLEDALAAQLLPHDDIIKWKHFPHYWPFVRGIHRSPVNSPQRPVMRSFDVFFDLHLNKRLSKWSWDWWFETLSCPRHCNELVPSKAALFWMAYMLSVWLCN